MTHWSKKSRDVAGLIRGFSHNDFVAVPLKKPDDTGYPKCPDCVFADVPASTPLLKVYDYGPLGARFFVWCFFWGASLDQRVCVTRSEVREPVK